MLNYKTVSRKTYDRNVKNGKWIERRPPTEKDGFIETAHKTRGVYNSAGRSWFIFFSADTK
jgi:hypothetical protein